MCSRWGVLTAFSKYAIFNLDWIYQDVTSSEVEEDLYIPNSYSSTVFKTCTFKNNIATKTDNYSMLTTLSSIDAFSRVMYIGIRNMELGKRFYLLASPALLRVLTKGARAVPAGGLRTARPAAPVHYARLECAWLEVARESKCRRAKWESSIIEMAGSKDCPGLLRQRCGSQREGCLTEAFEDQGPSPSGARKELFRTADFFYQIQVRNKYAQNVYKPFCF